MTPLLLTPLLAYLLGAIPIGYLIARIVGGVDIRRAGSGNIGATNVARVVGKLPGLAVLALDALKGAAACWVPIWLGGVALPLTHPLRLLAGAAAVIGHVYPCFLKFQGGKGIATALGVLLVLLPEAAAVCGVVWLAVFFWKRYVSLASVAAALCLPLVVLLRMARADVMLFSVFLAWLAVYRHQPNIRRLYLGQEPRFGRPPQ